MSEQWETADFSFVKPEPREDDPSNPLPARCVGQVRSPLLTIEPGEEGAIEFASPAAFWPKRVRFLSASSLGKVFLSGWGTFIGLQGIIPIHHMKPKYCSRALADAIDATKARLKNPGTNLVEAEAATLEGYFMPPDTMSTWRFYNRGDFPVTIEVVLDGMEVAEEIDVAKTQFKIKYLP